MVHEQKSAKAFDSYLGQQEIQPKLMMNLCCRSFKDLQNTYSIFKLRIFSIAMMQGWGGGSRLNFG